MGKYPNVPSDQCTSCKTPCASVSGTRLRAALQASFHSYWVGGGIVGVAIASFLPGRIEGLEYALCALFITLTLDACRSRRQIPSLLLSGLAYTSAAVVVPGSALFLGLLVFVALLLGRYQLQRHRERRHA